MPQVVEEPGWLLGRSSDRVGASLADLLCARGVADGMSPPSGERGLMPSHASASSVSSSAATSSRTKGVRWVLAVMATPPRCSLG